MTKETFELNRKMVKADRDEILKVASNMTDYGGGFVQALGEAIYRADSENVERIKKAFPEYWEDFKEMGD